MAEASVGTRVERERLKQALLGTEPVAVRLGRFIVVERLGAGGMGVVLEAYDPELERGVAIKVLGSHVAREPESRERLRREARALASLSHRNVVGVHEVGVEGEHLFVVMELVRGPTLRAWLAERRRPWREILAVFVAAGRGLAAAHERGLVHRDFKPDNVLIAHDGTPRVVDFGLVRSLGSAVASTLSGASGDEDVAPDERLTDSPLGTPRYMSPEQASGGVVDARSDQYSLCFAMLEAFSEAGRDAPPRRVVLALRRGTAPRPEDRWPGLDALLTHLTRAARPRRAALLGVAAVASLAGAFALWPRSPAACAASEAAADGTWTPERAEAVRTALARPDLHLSGESQARIVERLGAHVEAWRSVAQQSCRVRLSPEAAAHRSTCLENQLLSFGAYVDGLARAPTLPATAMIGSLPDPDACLDPPPEVAVGEELAALLATLHGKVLAYELEPALALAHEGLGRAEQLGDRVAEAALHFQIAVVHSSLSRFDLQKESLEAAFWAAYRIDDEVIQARAASFLAVLVATTGGEPEAAERWLELARGVVARGTLPDPVEIQVLRNEASVLAVTGRQERALATFTEVLHRTEARGGPDEPTLASILFGRSAALDRLKRYSEAAADLRRAIALMDRQYGPSYLGTLEYFINLGSVLRKLGELDEAGQVLEDALARTTEAFGEAHLDTLLLRINLSAVRLERRDAAGALALLEGVPEALARHVAPEHAYLTHVYGNRCAALTGVGRPAQALPECLRARDIAVAAFGERSIETAELLGHLGDALRALGRVEEELPLRHAALEIYAEHHHPAIAPQVALAGALAANGRTRDAREALDRARAAHERRGAPAPGDHDVERSLQEVSAMLERDREAGRTDG